MSPLLLTLQDRLAVFQAQLSNKNKELQRYLYRPLPQRNSRQCKHIFFAKRDDPSSNYGKRKIQSKNNSVKSIGYNTDRRIILVQLAMPSSFLFLFLFSSFLCLSRSISSFDAFSISANSSRMAETALSGRLSMST